MVVVEAVLPDPFIEEAVALVASVHHGANELTGCGSLGSVERCWGGIHLLENLRRHGQASNV